MKKVGIFLCLCISIYSLYSFIYPKKYSTFCLEEQCITIVIEYKPTISGGDKSISLYSGRLFSRLHLLYRSYMEFPVEMDVLIHKELLNGKFLILTQVLPTYKKGNINDYIQIQLINYYSEGNNDNISALNLTYRNMY